MNKRVSFGASVALLFLSLFASGARETWAQQSGGGTAARPATSPTASSSKATSNDSSAPKLPAGVSATERAVDASIPDDPTVNTMLEPYSAKVRALETIIGKLAGDLKRDGMGSGSLGNFVADAMLARGRLKLQRPIVLALTNRGGLRKNVIAAGDLRVRDIFELLPFENALVAVDLNGEQLTRLLRGITDRRDAQSGALIKYRSVEERKNEFVSATLIGPGAITKEIDPNATYAIITSDYLVSGSNDYPVFKESKNIQPLGITLRDAVLEQMKAEAAAGREIKSTLDGRFELEETDLMKKEGKQP